MDLPDDKQLLRRLKEGDKESFRIIFERNAPVFLAFARRLLRDPDVAEDIVQNVFMRLWIARERVDEERNLRNLQPCIRLGTSETYFRMCLCCGLKMK